MQQALGVTPTSVAGAIHQLVEQKVKEFREDNERRRREKESILSEAAVWKKAVECVEAEVRSVFCQERDSYRKTYPADSSPARGTTHYAQSA